jgi:serine/threonine protein kinase
MLNDKQDKIELTQAIDYWSLGCVIYYMIQVKSPFARLNRLIKQKFKFENDKLAAMEILNRNKFTKMDDEINQETITSITPNKSLTTVNSSKSTSSKDKIKLSKLKQKPDNVRKKRQIFQNIKDSITHVKCKIIESKSNFKSLSFKSEKNLKGEEKVLCLKSSASVSKINCSVSESCSLIQKVN